MVTCSPRHTPVAVALARPFKLLPADLSDKPGDDLGLGSVGCRDDPCVGEFHDAELVGGQPSGIGRGGVRGHDLARRLDGAGDLAAARQGGDLGSRLRF